MTFLRLTVNFSSLQLTDICKKVTSHARSSAELISVLAKFFKARRTPRIVVPRGEKTQKVLNKRFQNSINDKFRLGTGLILTLLTSFTTTSD